MRTLILNGFYKPIGMLRCLKTMRYMDTLASPGVILANSDCDLQRLHGTGASEALLLSGFAVNGIVRVLFVT
jgi:hypothetical protein